MDYQRNTLMCASTRAAPNPVAPRVRSGSQWKDLSSMIESRRQLARDARLAVREGPEGIARRQRARLTELVA